MTSFAGCDLPYLATTMEYAGGPKSTTFIGFIVLLTLPVSAGIARQMGQGASFEPDRVKRSDLSIS